MPPIPTAPTPTITSLSQIQTRPHSVLSGLSADDHAQYALLAGRSGGQTVKGDTAASGVLTLLGTNHATPGNITLNTSLVVSGVGLLTQTVASSATVGFGTRVSGDTQDRFQIRPDGLWVSAGSTTPVAGLVWDSSGRIGIGNLTSNAGQGTFYVNNTGSSGTASIFARNTASGGWGILVTNNQTNGLAINASSSGIGAKFATDHTTFSCLEINNTTVGSSGSLLSLKRQSSTTLREVGQIDGYYESNTDASRTAGIKLFAVDSAGTREIMRGYADGSVARIGFFGSTAVVRQTVGAALSTGGAETNTNLATRINELRTAFVNLGLAA